MTVVTTATRPWSFSVIKAFETCPRQCHEVTVTKQVKEEPGAALLWGSRVHEAMQLRLVLGKPLPDGLDYLEKWAQAVRGMPGQLKVEEELALDKHYKPTGWFAKDVWVRAKVDVIKVSKKKALILDWKTGKKRPDMSQLELCIATTQQYFPDVKDWCGTFVWLDDQSTSTVRLNSDELPGVWDSWGSRADAFAQAQEDDDWPERPGIHCRWCPVTACPLSKSAA